MTTAHLTQQKPRSSKYSSTSWEILPEANFPFAGSDEILKNIFDAINGQVFNGVLDGITFKWCDKLKSCSVISYERSTFTTTQTYILCSKSWFANHNRKQFVEAILYEMIQMYMQKRFAQETNPDLEAFLIHGAMNYFNRKFQTNLTMNHNSDGNYDDSDVKDILSSAAILDINPKLKEKSVIVVDADVKLWSKKFTGNMDAVKCSEGCGGFCYCPATMALRSAYIGANIYFIFTVEGSQCFLCEKNFKEGTLNAHFNKDCPAFGRPRSTTNN